MGLSCKWRTSLNRHLIWEARYRLHFMTTYLNKNHRFLRPLDGRSAFVNVIAREIGCYVELTHHRDNPIAMS